MDMRRASTLTRRVSSVPRLLLVTSGLCTSAGWSLGARPALAAPPCAAMYGGRNAGAVQLGAAPKGPAEVPKGPPAERGALAGDGCAPAATGAGEGCAWAASASASSPPPPASSSGLPVSEGGP